MTDTDQELEGFIALLARLKLAIDLLERQTCNCLMVGKKVKVQCLRCELLEILR